MWHWRHYLQHLTWTVKAKNTRRITAAEMKYMRRTAGYSRTDYKTNRQIAMELKITSVLDNLLEYKRSCIQHVNRMPRNRLPSIMKHYSATGRMNHGRPLKRLLDTWDRNGSTIGPTPWQIYDDDDDDDDDDDRQHFCCFGLCSNKVIHSIKLPNTAISIKYLLDRLLRQPGYFLTL